MKKNRNWNSESVLEVAISGFEVELENTFQGGTELSRCTDYIG